MGGRAVPLRNITALRRLLPEGGSLPYEVWRNRHRGIVVVLWLHAAFIPVFALARGFSILHALAEAAVVPAAALAAGSPRLGRRAGTVIASLGLLSSSAILVHLSGGTIEMHFHFFVMVALVTLYQDWLPFLAAIAYVFVHHGLIGAIAPESVFNHVAGRNGPWRWAAIHALFITALSLVCVMTWRLNEALLGQRRQAEEQLRQESRIAQTLHEVGTVVASELDTERVVQTVTDKATDVTGAAFGAFFYNVTDEAGESFMLYTLSGAPIEAFSKFGLPRNTDIFRPTFEGREPVRLHDVTADPRYGKMAPHHGMPEGHPSVRSYLAVPVRARDGSVLGGLFFGHPEPGRFTEVDERIAVGIAIQATIAIENAKLYESERESRLASEMAGARLSLMVEATKVLSSSLELDVLMNGLARLVSPEIAGACLVDLVDNDGSIRRVASVAVPGVRQKVAALDQSDMIATAIRSGRPQITDETTVIPLTGRREVLGTLSLVTLPASSPALAMEHHSFAEDLARRAAIAVENARLFARQRTVAETLQHSLLPERMPEIPGLGTAALYLPGGPDVEVGGDWYDVIQLPGGHVGLAMGDVVGRGERAAALMGLVRNAARAYAVEGRSPAKVIESLNRLLLDAGADHMATMFYGVLDAASGVLTFTNAGHPPPLLAEPGREPTFVEGIQGLPIGALATARYAENRCELSPGSTLLLYTDGLVETRTMPLEVGLGHLRDAVREGPRGLDALCAHVVRRGLGDRPGQDDVAVLAVQLLPLGKHLQLRLPSDPAVLGPLRAILRRWLAQEGAGPQECHELLTACGEAATNAIRHAGTPPGSHFILEATHNGCVEIRIRDHGYWRQPRAGVGGRGIDIIGAYVDDLDIERTSSGTEVRLRRRLCVDDHDKVAP